MITAFPPMNDETPQVRQQSWESKVLPPKATPPINKALLRDY